MDMIKPLYVHVQGKFVDFNGCAHNRIYTVAFCGTCGNPLKPNKYARFCKWCGSGVDFHNYPRAHYTTLDKYVTKAYKKL